MPNWSDPAEIQKDGDVFTKLMFSLFGVYVWELFITSGFEWSLITGKRKFKWPMVVFFFLCRYCILWALIGLIISFSVTTEVNCMALYTFNSWCGNMTILSASTSLMLRTVALWERRWKIVVPVGILSLGQWALLWYGMFIVKAEWVPSANACVVVKNNHVFLNIVFFYTMAFDCIILLLTTAALMRQTSRSGLWDLLFRDGLVYFLVTFTCNCLPAVLNVLNLNVIMDVVATVPAATISAIAACRAVIRLQEFASGDPYIHSSSVTNDVRIARYGTSVKTPRYTTTRPEVHVTTDHITMHEFSPSANDAPYDGRITFKTSLDESPPPFDLKYKSKKEEVSADDYSGSSAV